MPSCGVRPTVCPSDRRLSLTFVHSVETNKRIFKIFHHSSFIRTLRYGNSPTEIPLIGEENRDFRPMSGFDIDVCWIFECS